MWIFFSVPSQTLHGQFRPILCNPSWQAMNKVPKFAIYFSIKISSSSHCRNILNTAGCTKRTYQPVMMRVNSLFKSDTSCCFFCFFNPRKLWKCKSSQILIWDLGWAEMHRSGIEISWPVCPDGPQLLPTCARSHGTCALNRDMQSRNIRIYYRHIPIPISIWNMPSLNLCPVFLWMDRSRGTRDFMGISWYIY